MASDSICTQCGTVGYTQKVVDGSFLVELLLWLCFLLPGVIYSVWRLTTKRVACAACGSSALVPVGSPGGQQMVAAIYQPAPSIDMRTPGPQPARTTPWALPEDQVAHARAQYGSVFDAVVTEVSTHSESIGAHVDVALLTWLCDHVNAGTAGQLQLGEVLRARGGGAPRQFAT